MSNVIQLRARASTPQQPLAKPLRRVELRVSGGAGPVATAARKSRKAPETPIRGSVTAKGLGLPIEADDGHLLGLACFVMGVGTVQVYAPGLPADGVKVSARQPHVRELPDLTEGPVAVFLARFHTALYTATKAAKQRQDLVEWWEGSTLPVAVELVPAAHRRHTRLERGVYDENGLPMTAGQIAYKAYFARLLGGFKTKLEQLENPEPGPLDLPWAYISRVEDHPELPVAFNGPAYLAVQKLLYPMGFTRMPQSWAEFSMAYQLALETHIHREMHWMGGGEEWKESIVSIQQEYYPETADLFEALLDQNAEKVKELHAAKDYYALLVMRYDPERDLLMQWEQNEEQERRERQALSKGEAGETEEGEDDAA